MNISKILSYVVLAVGAIGIALWFVMNSAFSDLLAENGVTEAREIPATEAYGAVGPLYGLTILVFVLALVATLVTVLSSLFKNPASLKKTVIGLVLFLVVVAISYFVATGVETPMKDGEMLSANGAQWVGAGLNAFYILAIVAVGAMLVSGVKKAISN